MEDKSLKILIEEAIRVSLKAGKKERTTTLRMLLNEIKITEKIRKEVEVDKMISSKVIETGNE